MIPLLVSVKVLKGLARFGPRALTQLLALPLEGLGLLGIPERHARPAWLTALGSEARTIRLGIPMDSDKLPLWIQAAIRLGVRFVRVERNSSANPGRCAYAVGL